MAKKQKFVDVFDDPPPISGDQLLTLEDVMSMMKMSRASIYNFVSAGDLPKVKLGKSVRFPYMAVRKFIADRTEIAPKGGRR